MYILPFKPTPFGATLFRATPLVFAIAAINAGTISPAFAQSDGEAPEQPPEQPPYMEEIEVRASGYVDSLTKSLMLKQSSAGSVDTILAEDIADFPDQNLAEALQRLPGVTITREAGEGREITVRGLNSTFTRVQLNGMQAQSLSAGTGGVRTSRGFDFNVFASELFNQLSVYKTTSAELEEGSLGATVELRTAKPFDYSENVVALNVQETYNDASEEYKPRLSGLASWQNDSGTLGALFSASLSQRVINNTGGESGRWSNDGDWGECSACSTDDEFSRVNDAWYPRFPRYSDKTHEQDRMGYTASLQWMPADSTEISVDALYANIDATRYEPYMEAISLAFTGPTGLPEQNIAAYELDNYGTMTAATVEDVDVRSEYFVADWESDFMQISLDVTHDFTDKLTGKLLVGRSESELDNREVTIIYEHFGANDTRKLANYPDADSTLYYDFGNKYHPSLAYSFDTTNPANWEMSEYRDRIWDASSTSDNARVDLEYRWTEDLVLKGGASYKEYGYEIFGARADASFEAVDGNDGAVDGNACGISYAVTAADGSVTSNGGQEFFLPSGDRISDFVNSGCWPYAPRASDNREVTEESTGYFVQLDFATPIAGRILRGNLGVRYVETDLTSTGIVNDEDEVTVTNNYDDTLPSINLAYEITDELVLRSSWAKVMSRPDLTTLSPGGAVAIYGVPYINYGNPFIEPFRADALDLSLEWYFDEGALVSIAYFEKDIKSFPTSDTITINWQDTGLPDSLLGAQRDDLMNQDFEVRTTVNGEGGTLDGVEFQYQQPLTFLPGPDWVRNFGVLANMTWVDSEVTYGEGRTGPLTGQSDESGNLTLYWENDLFSARVSAAYRGEFYTSLSDSSSELWRLTDATTFWDFSASYQINDRFKVSLEGINITDEPIQEYMDPVSQRMILEQNTGRQFFLGLSYRM